MGRGLLWNVGVLVVVFRKQVGSYRSRRQGQSRRREEGRRADEKDQAECRAKGKRKKKRRGGPQRVVYDYEWGADEVSWVVGGFLGSLCLFFFFFCAQFSLFLVTLSLGEGYVWVLGRNRLSRRLLLFCCSLGWGSYGNRNLGSGRKENRDPKNR
ncbi:hypothetical protein CABS01_13660 [Colletotrichum abscissum]|uniref:uncharacterized protein n=1 Tax=Colletotrichum abscissum TaxID=1671311 RepID=UPI0027D6AC63|nr:uncharacterized protein CABS01_13660 [Colletotrichum abscissum]KAK1484903.1 hypothetical protein CABS01_13660 [Colletotrichum abscissum]